LKAQISVIIQQITYELVTTVTGNE